MRRVPRFVFMALLFVSLAGCATGPRIISVFGESVDGEGRRRPYPHQGVDVWGNPHAPVLASADGLVVTVAEVAAVENEARCGKYIVIDHDEELVIGTVSIQVSTKYCHLAASTVVEGTKVKRGEVIGSIGTTGWRRIPIQTTGYEHVHWELLKYGRPADPLPATVGCFDPKQSYPKDRLVLTYPVKC